MYLSLAALLSVVSSVCCILFLFFYLCTWLFLTLCLSVSSLSINMSVRLSLYVRSSSLLTSSSFLCLPKALFPSSSSRHTNCKHVPPLSTFLYLPKTSTPPPPPPSSSSLHTNCKHVPPLSTFVYLPKTSPLPHHHHLHYTRTVSMFLPSLPSSISLRHFPYHRHDTRTVSMFLPSPFSLPPSP